MTSKRRQRFAHDQLPPRQRYKVYYRKQVDGRDRVHSETFYRADDATRREAELKARPAEEGISGVYAVSA